MPPQPTTRFALIGGFLGAGKTTLISQLAARYVAAGKNVGIITNDQAADLVDTQHLRSQGFDVGEVAGACFCCSFDNLLETAARLSATTPPDVLLAEPVGSCTDLVATVVLPLQQMYGNRFELSPFGVLLKPSHGRRILDVEAGGRSGFSPQAEYIFRKQLDEADYLMIGRSDQLSDNEMQRLRNLLAAAAPGVPVLSVSGKDGTGVDDVLGYIESPAIAGRRVLEIDYDIYAEGEAELGWVNLSSQLNGGTSVDLDHLAAELVADIAHRIAQLDGEIAHLKVAVGGDGLQAIANIVSSDGAVDVGLRAGREATGTLQVIVNARVAVDPEELKRACGEGVEAIARSLGLTLTGLAAHALRPGRPTPTHRLAE